MIHQWSSENNCRRSKVGDSMFEDGLFRNCNCFRREMVVCFVNVLIDGESFEKVSEMKKCVFDETWKIKFPINKFELENRISC